MCTNFEINRYKIDEFRKDEKNRIFYLTSRDANRVCRTSLRMILLIGIVINNILQPEVSTTFGSKVMAQTVVLMFLMTLTLTVVLLIVTQSRHKVMESPCEVS